MTKQRVELSFADWPEPDIWAWAELFREGDVLDGQGAAIDWSQATRKTNFKHYARWLGWLARTGHLAAEDPVGRATAGAHHGVRAGAGGQGLAPRTVASALIGLKCVLMKMKPEADWRWLMDLTNRLDSSAEPLRDHRARILPAEVVFDGALAELARLAAAEFEARESRLEYRNVLMVAFLVGCPVRERNLSQIRVSEHLRRVGTDWRLYFGAGETKTRQALDLIIPRRLVPWLDLYLDEVRPHLPQKPGSTDLWPGCKGRAMAPNTIYQTVMRTTQRLFGVGINPHSFRSIAATRLALGTVDDGRHARPLLGHRRPETTAEHYTRADPLEASRQTMQVLRELGGMSQTQTRRAVGDDRDGGRTG